MTNETFTYSWYSQDKPGMDISTVVTEFLEAKRSQRLSVHTLADYENSLKKFVEMFGKMHMTSIEPKHIREYLGSLDGLSNKTVKNHWATLSSLWSWSIREGYAIEHTPKRVRPPRPEKRAIKPFERQEILAMLAATQKSQLFATRDKAMLLVLMDTGLRASELCGLRISDISGTQLYVMGKGAKERYVPLSDVSWRAILDYLRDRPDDSEALFVSYRGEALTRSGLQILLRRISKRAGVKNVHPHRFRHTFAVSYLMNGGDPFTLKKILGHATMDMVENYLELSRDNVSSAHAKASPVKGMGV